MGGYQKKVTIDTRLSTLLDAMHASILITILYILLLLYSLECIINVSFKYHLILSIYPVFLMAMPVNMILVMYVILCILSYDFNKLTMLYIHVHTSISMTNKSGLIFFLSIKYLSVCKLRLN